MNYPLQFSFKILAIASQIYIRDSDGQLLGYVKQKLFKLKEDINIFADETMAELRYNIKADRVLDFSAQYNFTSSQGRPLGSLKRKGMRSIWKANYDLFDTAGQPAMKINEENGWIKVVDSLIGEVPVVGMFSGYFFNPSYVVSRSDGTPVARIQKQPALFEGRFQLDSLGNMSESEEELILLGVLTMTMLERSRG